MKISVFDIMLFVAFAASQLGGIEAEAMHNESSLLLRQDILRRSAIIRSNLMSLFSWQQERRMLFVLSVNTGTTLPISFECKV